MPEGVRGKYVERYRAETHLVLLDSDPAQALPDAIAIDQALRLLVQIAQRQQFNSVVQQTE